ncbi:MAG: S41 family peptidase [Thermomicrobiales bacterium]
MTVSAAGSERVYVGQQAGLSASIPSTWTFDRTGTFDYAGADGFIQSDTLPQQTLLDACTFLGSDYAVEAGPLNASWSGKPACTLDVQTSAGPGRVLVVPMPKPITMYGASLHFAFVLADNAHFDAVVSSLSFDPSRVSAEAFVASVIDLVEARAWWSDRVDWATLRPSMLARAKDLPNLASSQTVVRQLIDALRLGGDNHSFLISPRQASALGQIYGFGMQVADGWIVSVYPDGPAARAGIQVGDHILTANGLPPQDTYGFDPVFRWGPAATFVLERTGQPASLTVRIVAGQYSGYQPVVAALVGPQPLGYLAIPAFGTPGREREFVERANDQVGIIDRRGACGWIIDLRLNGGGDYRPMISALGPILGNGTFVGWEFPDGETHWVSYQDGVIRDNGEVASEFVPADGFHALSAPLPPVAVLLGPGTASSGEVTALAFVGRPNTLSFGLSTGGWTTANATFRLFDGSNLGLAVAAMVDRSGQTHLDGIAPDQVVPGSWSTFGTDQDPVIQVASDWLMRQPGCAGATGTPEPSPAPRP